MAMDAMVRYALYFMMGGILMAGTGFINEAGKGGVASLVASLPIVLLINTLIAYYTSGPTTAFDFVKGMCIINIPWLAAAIVLAYGIHCSWNVMATSVAMMATYLALAKLATCMVI
jgi:hypothetical protein